MALSQQLPFRLMLPMSPWRASSALCSALAYWLPRSACTTRPGCGQRLAMAMLSAAHTSCAGMLGTMAQPTTLRENRSSTAARYSQPLRVRT